MTTTSEEGWTLKADKNDTARTHCRVFLTLILLLLLVGTACSKLVSVNRRTSLNEAEEFFQSGQYVRAAPLYEQELRSKARERDRILLRLAVSYLLIEGPGHRPGRARELLETLIQEHPESSWKPYAQAVLSAENQLEESQERNAALSEAVASYQSRMQALANEKEGLAGNLKRLQDDRELLEKHLQLRETSLENIIKVLEKESRQNAALRTEVDRLKEELEELKKIDLGRFPSP